MIIYEQMFPYCEETNHHNRILLVFGVETLRCNPTHRLANPTSNFSTIPFFCKTQLPKPSRREISKKGGLRSQAVPVNTSRFTPQDFPRTHRAISIQKIVYHYRIASSGCCGMQSEKTLGTKLSWPLCATEEQILALIFFFFRAYMH